MLRTAPSSLGTAHLADQRRLRGAGPRAAEECLGRLQWAGDAQKRWTHPETATATWTGADGLADDGPVGRVKVGGVSVGEELFGGGFLEGWSAGMCWWMVGWGEGLLVV